MVGSSEASDHAGSRVERTYIDNWGDVISMDQLEANLHEQCSAAERPAVGYPEIVQLISDAEVFDLI